MKYPAIAFTAILFLGLVGCKQEHNTKATELSKQTISELVDDIANHPTVDQQLTGIGIVSKQYKRFETLAAKATDEELARLTTNPNVNVRAYAFWALAKRNYPRLTSIFEQNLCDKTPLKFASGCTSLDYPVNEFYISILTQNSLFKGCKKLENEKIKVYRAQIK